jgi:hypothetical protein
MMGEDRVVIVDGTQIRRELALERGDIEPGAQVPQQRGALLGWGCPRDRNADESVAGIEGSTLEIRIVYEQLRARHLLTAKPHQERTGKRKRADGFSPLTKHL